MGAGESVVCCVTPAAAAGALVQREMGRLRSLAAPKCCAKTACAHEYASETYTRAAALHRCVLRRRSQQTFTDDGYDKSALETAMHAGEEVTLLEPALEPLSLWPPGICITEA